MAGGAFQEGEFILGYSFPFSNLLESASFDPSFLFAEETLVFYFQKCG